MLHFIFLRRLFAILIAATFCVSPAFGADSRPQALVRPAVGASPLSPFLDYYIDESLSMDIEEAAAPSRAHLYKPLSLEELPRVEGITWLRFTLAAAPADGRAGTYLLDMGQSIPGVPTLYDPERNELSGALEWRENTPAQRNILLLPEAGPAPLTCYIRIDGLPGPWFSPIIRTPQNAAGNWSSLSRTGAILALGVVMLLCLLRGLSENGQWRIWTAMYVAVALAQALLGMPAIAESMGVKSLAAILSPGIALMLLPHVGRHLMRTNGRSRLLDIQLLLLSLPGAALALWPLAPGWNWLDRWLDLWPLVIAIFIPTALGAWIAGLGGSRRFLLGCLIPPVFAVISMAGLEFGVPSNLLSSGPIWGVALSALLIAATRSPWDMMEQDAANHAPSPAEPVEESGQEGEIVILKDPLDDPNLRIDAPEAEEASAPVTEPQIMANLTNARENSLRGPIDDMLREGAALSDCVLPAPMRLHVNKMVAAARRMGNIIANGDDAKEAPRTPGQSGPFNLQKVLRGAHDAIAPAAEKNAVSLSWHMPPHLSRNYRGRWGDLEKTLLLLLESSVRASHKGVVRLSARLVPESAEPGHILFTITDNGAGNPPNDRSSMALARAWEMVRENGGYMGMESGSHGTTIAFSLRFAPIPEDGGETEGEAHIIVACEDDQQRHEVAAALAHIECRVSEAANMHEALVTQSLDPAPLLIARGTLALPASGELARRFADMATQAGFSRCHILAITLDESTWPELKPAGFTHAMVEPFDQEELARIALELSAPEKAHGAKNKTSAPAESETSADGPEAIITPIKMQHEDVTPESATIPEPDLPEPDVVIQENEHEDQSLSMLVDQKMEVTSNFEGPEWLESRKTPMEKSKQEAKPAAVPEPPAVPESEQEPVEWVGEPKPIIKKAPKPEQKVDKETERLAGGADFEEWVGEPMPIKTAPQKNHLTDFIVGVERKEHNKPAAEPASQDTMAPAPERKAPTSSAAPGKDEFIVEKEGGADSVDPVIIGLVEKLDAYMREAQNSYNSGNCELLALITGQIASESESFGLRWMARFAKCVEQAAQANDLKAVQDLLPELSLAIERNKVTLLQKK